jgi:predicted glycosyltransferase
MLDTASSTSDVRIVVMSSMAHEYASWDPDRMNAEEEQYYDRIKVYGVTKLYNVSLRFYFSQGVGVSGNVPPQ